MITVIKIDEKTIQEIFKGLHYTQQAELAYQFLHTSCYPHPESCWYIKENQSSSIYMQWLRHILTNDELYELYDFKEEAAHSYNWFMARKKSTLLPDPVFPE